jgi:hypothetical protein
MDKKKKKDKKKRKLVEDEPQTEEDRIKGEEKKDRKAIRKKDRKDAKQEAKELEATIKSGERAAVTVTVKDDALSLFGACRGPCTVTSYIEDNRSESSPQMRARIQDRILGKIKEDIALEKRMDLSLVTRMTLSYVASGDSEETPISSGTAFATYLMLQPNPRTLIVGQCAPPAQRQSYLSNAAAAGKLQKKSPPLDGRAAQARQLEEQKRRVAAEDKGEKDAGVKSGKAEAAQPQSNKKKDDK